MSTKDGPHEGVTTRGGAVLGEGAEGEDDARNSVGARGLSSKTRVGGPRAERPQTRCPYECVAALDGA